MIFIINIVGLLKEFFPKGGGVPCLERVKQCMEEFIVARASNS